jgi:hypothetical protein
LASRDLQAIDEDRLNFSGFRPTCCLQNASLETQDFRHGPALTIIGANSKSLLDSLQCDVNATRFDATLGFQYQKHRQPQPGSPLLPTDCTFAKHFNALVNLTLVNFSPALDNPATI